MAKIIVVILAILYVVFVVFVGYLILNDIKRGDEHNG